MNTNIHASISNLKPFDYSKHYTSHFINQNWVLVNGIAKKKAIYTFRTDHVLEIKRSEDTIKTAWDIDVKNVFSVETEDGLIIVKAYFRDKDILVLDHQDKDDFAMFINITDYDMDINSVDDIQEFLKLKYQKKVAETIYRHEFYYIEKSEEFGPYKVEDLNEKVNQEEISPYCFVRDINEDDYSRRLRIADLIQEI